MKIHINQVDKEEPQLLIILENPLEVNFLRQVLLIGKSLQYNKLVLYSLKSMIQLKIVLKQLQRSS